VIIVRAPLRITLGGGGSDVKSYYEKHRGFCLTAAIDKYVYITVHDTFVDYLILKYSEIEHVKSRTEVKHPIIREVLISQGIDTAHLEISSMADIPAGTGLGSSSAFTVALLKAIRTWIYKNDSITAHRLAETACYIEIDQVGEPIGKQDQYASAYGGLKIIDINRQGDVTVSPLHMTDNTRHELEDNLLLFFTGYSRSTANVLNLTRQYVDVDETLGDGIASAHRVISALEEGNLYHFAQELTCQRGLKIARLVNAENDDIEHWFRVGMSHGAIGGKLVGAGGGGFLMFMAEDSRELRKAMNAEGLPEVRFRFDYEGARAILQ